MFEEVFLPLIAAGENILPAHETGEPQAKFFVYLTSDKFVHLAGNELLGQRFEIADHWIDVRLYLKIKTKN